MTFIQIIEIETTHIDEVQKSLDQWMAKTDGKRAAHRATLTEDRDRTNTYLQIVEFPSYASAMANSELPETSEFAQQLAKLCETPPTFRNLDVRRVFDLG